VLDHPVAAHEFVAQHRGEFRVCVRAVGAERVDEGDLLSGHVAHLVQQEREHAPARHRAGSVGEDDRDRIGRAHALPQRWGTPRRPQGGEDRGAFIADALHRLRFDNGDVTVREIHH
jgi:hypothetical protein